jgi:hypothetical protein
VVHWLVAAVVSAPVASAQTPVLQVEEPTYDGGSLYIDQDTFLRKSERSDQFYTMGVLAARNGHWVVDQRLDRGLSFVDKLFGGRLHRAVLGIGRPGPQSFHDSIVAQRAYTAHTFLGGVSAFTPLKGPRGATLGRRDPIVNDRPYACLLYLTTRRTSARGNWAFSTDLTVGSLGLQICKVVQTEIHEWVTHDTAPGGWHNQISNGGEPTANYRIAVRRLALAAIFRRQPFTTQPDPDESQLFDLTIDGEGNAGYYVNAAAGARVRLGLINSTFWSTPRRPVGPISKKLVPFAARMRAPGGPFPRRRTLFGVVDELYAWASAGHTYWGRNALLQGQFRDSPVQLSFDVGPTPDAASLERSVSDVQFGAAIRIRRFSLAYQYNSHSRAFKGPSGRVHRWGGFYLGMM